MEPTSSSPMKRILLIGLLVILLLGLILGVAVVSQKNKSAGGTTGDKPLAKVGDKNIYQEDVRTQAEKKYGAAADDPKILNSVLDETKKRAIMDQEATKAGITVTDEEINASAQSQFPDSYQSLPDTFREAIKYTLLENKLTAKFVDSRTAYTIGFWVPPLSAKDAFTAEKNATYDQQRQAGEQALNEALARLQKGQEPLAIVNTLNKNYSVLKPIMGLNGYIVDGAKDQYLLTNPRVYTYQKQTDTKELFDTMFNINAGDIKKVDSADGAGGFVVKVVAVNKSQFKTFEEWLQSRAAEIAQ